MTPAQHQRIKDLFDEAFELPLATQARWLAQACPDDEAVHAEVEKLLHSQATHPAFLEAQSAAELLDRFAIAFTGKSRNHCGMPKPYSNDLRTRVL